MSAAAATTPVLAHAGVGYRTRARKITKWRTCSRCSPGSKPRIRIWPPSWCRDAGTISTAVLLPALLAPRIPEISPEPTDDDSARETGGASEPVLVPSNSMPVLVMARSSGIRPPRRIAPGSAIGVRPEWYPLDASTPPGGSHPLSGGTMPWSCPFAPTPTMPTFTTAPCDRTPRWHRPRRRRCGGRASKVRASPGSRRARPVGTGTVSGCRATRSGPPGGAHAPLAWTSPGRRRDPPS